jgi:hypothetical protein
MLNTNAFFFSSSKNLFAGILILGFSLKIIT